MKEQIKIEAQVAKVLEACRGWYPDIDLAGRAATLREVFDDFDCDGGGELDIDELRPFMAYFLERYLGVGARDGAQALDLGECVEGLFYALDGDNSATIDFSEFLWCVEKGCAPRPPRELVLGRVQEAGEVRARME